MQPSGINVDECKQDSKDIMVWKAHFCPEKLYNSLKVFFYQNVVFVQLFNEQVIY